MNETQYIKIEEIKNFPFESFERLNEAYAKGEVLIDLRMDVARQWAMSGRCPAKVTTIANLLAWTFFLFALFIIIYPIIIHKYLYILLIIPTIISAFMLTPVARRFMGCLNYVILVGIGLFFYSFYSNNKVFCILLSLTVILPWIIWSALYKYAISAATESIMKDEKLFIDFVNCRAVKLSFPNNNVEVWLGNNN